jgi:hypothetical protein
VEVYGPQYESVWGQSNQNPSEYVPTSGAPASKYFSNENGNTVSSNVVTEAVGPPLAEQPSLLSQPAMTNLCLYSNDFTNAAWDGDAAAALDQAGLTGATNTASLVSDTSGVLPRLIRQVTGTVSDTNPLLARLYVKKDSDTSRFPHFIFETGVGGIANKAFVSLNTQTGATSLSGSASSAVDVKDAGLWWEVLIQVTNNSRSGARITLYPAYSAMLGGVADATLQGSIIVGGAEVYQNAAIAEVAGSSPIITKGSTVTRGGTLPAFAFENQDSFGPAVWSAECFIPAQGAGNSWLGNHTTNPTRHTLSFSRTSSGSYGIPTSQSISVGFTVFGTGIWRKSSVAYSEPDGLYTVYNDDGSLEGTFVGYLTTNTPVKVGNSTDFDFKGVALWRNIRRYEANDYDAAKIKAAELVA